MPTKRTITRERDDARTTRDRVVEQRDTARTERDAAIGNQQRLARQLSDVRDELDALRKDPPPAGPEPEHWAAERTRLRQQLDLSERARASLDTQAVQLGQLNDQLTREAQDRAVTAEVTR